MNWTHYPITPHPSRCAECGACDCRDGHHGEAYLCQMVGECGGLAYDVYQGDDGTIICDSCHFEREHNAEFKLH